MDPDTSVVASNKGLLEEVRNAQQPKGNMNKFAIFQNKKRLEMHLKLPILSFRWTNTN